MSDSAAPVLPDHVKKPNEEDYKKSLETVNQNIEKIQKQFVNYDDDKKKKKTFIFFSSNVLYIQDGVREKIAKLPQKNDNARREEIKTELNEIRDKQAELKKTRKAVYEQLDAINDSIRKKVS